MATSDPDGPDNQHCLSQWRCLQLLPQMALQARVPTGKMTSQVTKTPKAAGEDQETPVGMEETKAKQEVSHKPPIPRSQESPAYHQPLATRFVPFVAHFGGHQPDSFKFLFYQPTCSNSYSPFYTAQKPTCGYRYHRDTDHTRKVIDVSSVNIVKWSPSMGRRP